MGRRPAGGRRGAGAAAERCTVGGYGRITVGGTVEGGGREVLGYGRVRNTIGGEGWGTVGYGRRDTQVVGLHCKIRVIPFLACW